MDGVDAAAGVVRVRGLDLVDGTPVLDLKPFVLADIAPHARWPAWLQQMLRLDVRSVHAKAKHQHKEYGVTLDDVGFVYTVDDTTRTSTVVAVHHYDPRTKHVVPPPRPVPWPSTQQPDAAPSSSTSSTTTRTEHEQ